MFTSTDRAKFRDELAVSIAKSRYEAWDPAGQAGIPWEVFREQHADTATSIYLADGYRDADAAMPLVLDLLEHYGVVIEPTAADSATAAEQDDEEPTAEDLAELTELGLGEEFFDPDLYGADDDYEDDFEDDDELEEAHG